MTPNAPTLWTINVDIGGTFTDGVLNGPDGLHWVKTDTTPHDLTVGFLKCVEQLALTVDLSVEQLLAQTAVFRLASTIGTNLIIQKNGPRIGLMTSRRNGALHPTLAQLLSPELVTAVDEPPSHASGDGLDQAHAREAMEDLLDRGARGLVIALSNSVAQPETERRMRQIVNTEYPRHYLGAVKTWLGSELSHHRDDSVRLNTAVLNGYLHWETAMFLYKADEMLRRRGFGRPLLSVHAQGGAARVAKTTALHTYNSGPAAGLVGCAELARTLYGIKDFVSVDVGGTSVDIGVVRDGKVGYDDEPEVEGIAVGVPMIRLLGVAGGGGSIVTVDHESLAGGPKGLRVGPRSAGAVPGPACYGQGGLEATLTDADVILGHVNPNYFLGGRKKLDPGKARGAFKKVADSLEVSVEKAALAAVAQAESDAAAHLRARLEFAQMDPGRTVLFAFGGGGGLRCVGYASRLGIRKIIAFPFGSVACAIGICSMDVVHFYEKHVGIAVKDSGLAERLNQALESMTKVALRDMRGEGFSTTDVELTADAVVGGDERGLVTLPSFRLNSHAAAAIMDHLVGTATGDKSARQEVTVESIRLTARCAIPKLTVAPRELLPKNPSKAFKGHRPVHWGSGLVQTAIYAAESLEPGNSLRGPAVIEGADCTYLLPEAWEYSLDQYGNGLIERSSS